MPRTSAGEGMTGSRARPAPGTWSGPFGQHDHPTRSSPGSGNSSLLLRPEQRAPDSAGVKDHRRCAVDPAVILDPDASIRRAQVMAKEKKEPEASALDRPRPFRDDLHV